MGALRWHIDPGHGWLEVPTSEGLPFSTGYGYISPDGKTVFLEEDCEAPAYLDANPEATDIPVVNHGNFDAPCRQYRSIPVVTP